MQPNNNPMPPGTLPVQPAAPPPNGASASAAVDPGLENLTKTGAVFSDIGNSNEPSNPIAGTAAPQSSVIHDQASIDKSLDGVLQQVTSNIRAVPPTPPRATKKSFGLFSKPKTQKPHSPIPRHPSPPSPIANPIHHAAIKPKKPIIPITLAITTAVLLCIAAIKST